MNSAGVREYLCGCVVNEGTTLVQPVSLCETARLLEERYYERISRNLHRCDCPDCAPPPGTDPIKEALKSELKDHFSAPSVELARPSHKHSDERSENTP